MVHIHPADILHQRNRRHIADKNCKTDNTLQQRYQHMRLCKPLKKQRYVIRKHHKNCHCKYNRKYKRTSHHGIFLFLILLLKVRSLLLGQFFPFLLLLCILLILEKRCRISQCLHSKHQGFYKTEHTPQNGHISNILIFNDSVIFRNENLDFMVRFSHGNSVFFLILHHNAFHDCLSTNSRISHMILQKKVEILKPQPYL